MTENAGSRRRPTVVRRTFAAEINEREHGSTSRRRRPPVPWAVSDVFETINIPPYEAGHASRGEDFEDGAEYRSRRRRRGSGPEVVIEHVWLRPKLKSKLKPSRKKDEEKPVPRTETRYMEETRWKGDEKETTVVKETVYINPTIDMAGTGDKKLGIKTKKKEVTVAGLLASPGPDGKITVRKDSSNNLCFVRKSRRPVEFPVIKAPILTPTPPSSEG